MPGHTKVDTALVFDKRSYEPRAGITPFVCSTYDDFKEEHAILSSKVFADLNTLCQNRGAYFTPTRPVWDKSNDNVQQGYLLNTYFNYIQRCSPFFIGIIGERYGHHKDLESEFVAVDRNSNNNNIDLQSDIESGVEGNEIDWWDKTLLTSFKSGYEWVLEDKIQYTSLLELQVTQAAFREECEFCHFYYRQPEHKDALHTELPQDERKQKLAIYEPESEYCDMKVRELKQRVIKKGHPVKYFQTIEQLCGFVFDDWKQVIDQLCPPLCESISITSDKDVAIYKEWLAHETYAELRRKDYLNLPEHDDLLIDLTRFALTALDDPPDGWDKEEEGNALISKLRDKRFVMNTRPEDIQTSPRIRECSHIYCGGSNTMQEGYNILPEYPPAKYTSIYAIVGDRGSGKTSLISHWIKEFTQEYGFVRVFTHYVGCNHGSTDATNMLNRCMAYFSNQLQHNIDYIEETCGLEESLRSLGEVFSAAIGHQPCVIVLDGLDDLGKSNLRPDDLARNLSWLLYPLPPHVRMIVTTCRSDVSCQRLSKRPDTKLLEMPLLTSDSSKLEVLEYHLGLCKDKLSSEDQQNITRCRQTEKPLYLSVLASELRQPNVYKDLEKYVESYLETSSVRELVSKAIKRWLDHHSWTTSKNAVVVQGFKKKAEGIRETSGWVAEVLRLLAVSKNGLNHTEILQLLHHLGYQKNSAITEFDWLVFLDVMHDIVVYETSTGLLSFRHLHVREAVEHTLLSPEAPKMKQEFSINNIVPKKQPDPNKSGKQIERTLYHKAMANYLINKPHSDRRTQELPWQLIGCKDYTRLKQVVCEPRLFMSMYSNKVQRSDLIYFWECLQKCGNDPCAGYLDMLAMFTHDNEVPEITITEDNSEDSQIKEITFEAENGRDQEESEEKDEIDLDHLTLYVGQILADLEEFDTSLSVLSQLHASIYQRFPLNSKTEYLFCEVENSIASQLLQLDMLDDSAKFYEKTLSSLTDLLATLITPEEEKSLTEMKGKVLTHLASLYIMQQKKDEANQTLTQARRCMAQCGCVMGATQVLLTTGVLRLEQKEYFKADKCLSEAVVAFEKWYGKNHHKVADVLHEYAGLLCNPSNTHRYEKVSAEKMYRRALKLREQNYGSTHLIVAETLANFGKLLRAYKDTSSKNEALTMLRRAHDIRTTQLGPEHPSTKDIYKVLNNLDVTLQYNSRPHIYRESRPNNQLHSSLSWHESELLQFQLRFTRKRAQKRNKKLSMALKAVSALRTMRALFSSSKQSGEMQDCDKTDSMSSFNNVNKGTAMVSSSDIALTVSDTDMGWYGNIQGEELGTIQESERSTSELSVNDNLSVDGYRDVLAENRHVISDILADVSNDALHSESAKENDVERCESEIGNNFTKEDEGHFELESQNASARESKSSVVIKTALSSNMSDVSKVSVHYKPVSRVEIKPVDNNEYIDSYYTNPSASYSSVNIRESPRAVAKILRPQSAPFKMLQKYQSFQSSSSLRTTPISASRSSFVTPHARREISSAPVRTTTILTRSMEFNGGDLTTHKRNCKAPGPHSIHSSNTVSVINGPHASTESLLAPQVPRPVSQRLHHMSAWYHVPGRYTTSESLYPSKRNQKRVDNAQKKLVKNLKSRSAGKLLSPKFPTYLGTNSSSHFYA